MRSVGRGRAAHMHPVLHLAEEGGGGTHMNQDGQVTHMNPAFHKSGCTLNTQLLGLSQLPPPPPPQNPPCT